MKHSIEVTLPYNYVTDEARDGALEEYTSRGYVVRNRIETREKLILTLTKEVTPYITNVVSTNPATLEEHLNYHALDGYRLSKMIPVKDGRYDEEHVVVVMEHMLMATQGLKANQQ